MNKLSQADWTRNVARKAVQDCVDKANEFFYGLDMVYPHLEFHTQGRAAGRAWPHKHKISLHLKYLMSSKQADVKDMYEDTIPHEISHLICYRLYGVIRRGSQCDWHGPKWQAIMRACFNRPGERTHAYCDRSAGIKVRRQKRWILSCDCHKSFYVVTTRRKNDIESFNQLCEERGSSAGYFCKQCKGRLHTLRKLNDDEI